MNELLTLPSLLSQLPRPALWGLAAWMLAPLWVAGLALRPWRLSPWRLGLVAVVGLPLWAWMAWWLRGTFGDLGLLSIVGLLWGLWRCAFPPKSHWWGHSSSHLYTVLALAVALTGMALYANVLGVGGFDLYAFGQVEHPGLRDALWAHLGHHNLWSLCLDPLVVLAAVLVLWRRVAARARGATG